jgi:hypothetical protein
MDLPMFTQENFLKLFFFLIFGSIIANELVNFELLKITNRQGNIKINSKENQTISPVKEHQQISHIQDEKDFNSSVELFKRIIQFDCDPKNFKVSENCLLQLEKLDKHLLSLDRTELIPSYACDKCFAPSKKVHYHTFWNYDSFDITNAKNKNRLRMINLNLMSYLATQNLC